MNYGCLGGPLDGHECAIVGKAIPKQIAFQLMAKVMSRTFWAIYQYEPRVRCFQFVRTRSDSGGVPYQEDVCAKVYADFTSGLKWTVWTAMSDLQTGG